MLARLFNMILPSSSGSGFAAPPRERWIGLPLALYYLSLLLSVFSAVLSKGERYKVLRPIIVLYSVNVVDLFVRSKGASVRRFPHGSVFTDISFLVGARIIRRVTHNITLLCVNPAALPKMVLRTAFEYLVVLQEWQWMPAKVSAFAVCNLSDLRLLAASTFANARRYFLRLWKIRISQCVSELVSRYEPAATAVFMQSFGFNFAATAAFTYSHASNFTPYYRGCLAEIGGAYAGDAWERREILPR